MRLLRAPSIVAGETATFIINSSVLSPKEKIASVNLPFKMADDSIAIPDLYSLYDSRGLEKEAAK